MKRGAWTAVFCLLVVHVAWALPSTQEVDAAVRAGNLPLAEDLVRQVIRERPTSAKAHYELGQILAQEGRHREAVAELDAARRIDASLGFAASPRIFQEKFDREQRLVEAIPPQRQPVQVAKMADANASDSHGWVWVLLGAGIVGTLGFIIFRRIAKSKVEAERRDASQAQLARLLPLTSRLDDIRLEARAAAYGKDIKNQLVARADELSRHVASRIEAVKNGFQVDPGDVSGLADSVDTLAVWAATGNRPPEIPVGHNGGTFSAGGASVWGAPPAPVNQGNVYGSQPQVVVVDNSSGFVGGMIVGDLMRHDRLIERDRIIEREVPRPEGRRESGFDQRGGGWGGDSSDNGGSNSDW